MTSVNSGRYASYGTPPPWRKQSATAGTCPASSVTSRLVGARLRIVAPVRSAACSGGEGVRLRGGVVGEDAAGGHPTEPLAHVAFLEAGPLGQPRARGRPLGGGLEEPSP